MNYLGEDNLAIKLAPMESTLTGRKDLGSGSSCLCISCDPFWKKDKLSRTSRVNKSKRLA